MKICPRCKTKNLSSFKKCDGCGITLEGVYIRRSGTDHQQRKKAAKKYSGIVTRAGGKWEFACFLIIVAGLFTVFTSYINIGLFDITVNTYIRDEIFLSNNTCL